MLNLSTVFIVSLTSFDVSVFMLQVLSKQADEGFFQNAHKQGELTQLIPEMMARQSIYLIN